ncbi:type I secretion system permease/ATPase [Falsigemmobacter intermedius]|uniref:Type I secretion system permease/ATPase n=1 Tax=Falsigemmobacter intermedius TaxID=1553448 RepID=A0A3S3WDK6_9RHOB|nr:type I secretion system permease/ATPase [Falsigemmobacter intermedius]RWY36403.1 type I secretion system permease/ATPase [Falsigemmobacter intermedius]
MQQEQPLANLIPCQDDGLRQGLVLLCRHFGRDTREAELAEGLPLTAGRLALDDVPRALRRVGLTARIAHMRPTEIEPLLLPALLVRKDGGTFLLIEWHEDKAVVLLPEVGGGEVQLGRSQLVDTVTGTTILARPRYRGDSRAENYARRMDEHWMRGPLRDCWPIFAEVGVASFFVNLLAVVTSLFALQVYDRVIPTTAYDTLWVLTIGVGIAVFLEFMLRSLRAHLLDATGKRLDRELSSQLFAQLLQMRLSARPGSTGAFTGQLREFETVREFLTAATVGAISDLPFLALFLSLIAFVGGPIVWVPLAAIGLMLLPSLLLQGRLAALSRQNLREGAVKQGLLLEAVEHLETIKTTRSEGRNLRLWEELTEQLSQDSLEFRRLSGFLLHSAGMVQQLCYVGVVVYGVYRIGAGEMTQGALIACSMLASRAVAPINQMTGILVRWQHVKAAIEGLDAVMAAPVERPPGRAFVHKSALRGHYRLEGIQFRYGPEAPLTLDVTALEIAAGQHVILLGNNGAGKSSLLRLMSGLREPDAGRILLDDVSLGQIDPADLRRSIGYLPQEIALFHGTLRENLLLDGEAHDDEALFSALDATGLGPAVRAHPLGLDMAITGSGSLSTGQRQAVGIARVILQDPRIVLLDEPTSSLDQAAEARLIGYLQEFLKGRTVVISTHKRALLGLGTRGVVLQAGKVVMDGNLSDLMSGSQAGRQEMRLG